MNHRLARSRQFLGLAGVAIGLAGALTGCASPVERRPMGAYVGAQGATSSVVMPSEELAYAWPMAASENNAEYARSDARLGVRAASALPADAWPDPGYPSLDWARRVTISTRAETVTYFRPAPANAGTWPWPEGGRSVR